MGLRSATRTAPAAYWASWADALAVIAKRHRPTANRIVADLDRDEPESTTLAEVKRWRETLITHGFDDCPTWRGLLAGERTPPPPNPEADEWKHGWQFYSTDAIENAYQSGVVQNMDPSTQALFLSQGGPGGGRWLLARPTELSKTIEPARMLVALRRRLRAPLPMAARNCNAGRRTKCKRRLDAYGDHWASCMGSGRIQRRTKPLEHVLRKIFKEAGANVEKNPVFLRDTLVPGISQKDERQIEIVAKGLPFFNGGTICCDATMASPLDGWGHPRKGAATTAGVANEDSVKGKRQQASQTRTA